VTSVVIRLFHGRRASVTNIRGTDINQN